MKTNLFYKIILLFILTVFTLSSCVLATNTEQSDDVLASYEANYEYTSSDLFLYNANIEMSDIVDGNVFAFGSSVKITGEIYGDLFVYASTLDISEDAIIHGNVFAYAGTITVSGIVSDIYAVSNSFSLEKTAILARNLNLYSNTVSLSGQIKRDANISAGNITLDKDENVIVNGNLYYTSAQEAQIPDGAISGEVKFTPVETNSQNIILSAVFGIIKALIFSFVVIMLSIWITPKFKDRVCEIISKKSLKAFGIGLLTFFGIIILSFILLISTYGFGISIAVAGIALLILAYSISNTVFSMAIGKFIANKFNLTKNTPFVLLSLLIVLIIQLIKFVPYIGTPITFITAIVGLGTLCINAYKRRDLVVDKVEEK